MHTSMKCYDHNTGLSCVFRQHRAESHCRLLHGYALAFTFMFACEELDERGWVVDFGALKPLKEALVSFFDHKLLIAADDPYLDELTALGGKGLADYIVLRRVGCEAFAELAFNLATETLLGMGLFPRVRVLWCKVAEHSANAAMYYAPEAGEV